MATTTPADGAAEARPFLQIVKGNPTEVEIAVLTAVLAARRGGGASAPKPRSAWANPAYGFSAPITPGAGAWTASVRGRNGVRTGSDR